jgi:hypothetical protein
MNSNISRRSRSRKIRQHSSLEGFLVPETVLSTTTEDKEVHCTSLPVPPSPPSEPVYMHEVARQLRRAKRKMFLKLAEEPTNSVDRFRAMLMQLSSDGNRSSDDSTDDGSIAGSVGSAYQTYRHRSASFDSTDSDKIIYSHRSEGIDFTDSDKIIISCPRFYR